MSGTVALSDRLTVNTGTVPVPVIGNNLWEIFMGIRGIITITNTNTALPLA